MISSRIDEAIASANPFPDEQAILPGPGTGDELLILISTPDGAAGESRHKKHRRRARSRHHGTVRAVLTAAAVLTLSAAAWGALTARTGLFGQPGSEEGAGEMIRLDAPDAATVVDQLAAGIPLPPGRSFDEWKSKNLKVSSDGEGVMMSETGVRSTLSYVAACEWTGYWLDAFGRSDEGDMRAAQNVLDEIPGWKPLVESDAGGGVVSALKNRADAARRKQPSLFIREYKINCTDDHPPLAHE